MGSESQNISFLRFFFDGSDYLHWNFKMELYLYCDSIKLWDIVLKGWESPKVTMEGVTTILLKDIWNNDQKEENHENKKEMIVLIASISRKEWGKLCILAKEMWETLENHYEGNIQVRSKKV